MIRVVVDTPEAATTDKAIACLQTNVAVMAKAAMIDLRNARKLPYKFTSDILPGYTVTVCDTESRQ